MAAAKSNALDEALLDAVADHLVEHGLAGLTFRSLAQALDTSTFTFVYHFGSKAQLIDIALRHVSRREVDQVRSWLSAHDDGQSSVGGVMRRYWSWCMRPTHQGVMQLFFEAASLAQRDPEGYPPVVRDILLEGLELERQIVQANGGHDTTCMTIATLVSGAMWGLQLDYLMTGEGERTTAALHRFADVLDAHLAAGDPLAAATTNGSTSRLPRKEPV